MNVNNTGIAPHISLDLSDPASKQILLKRIKNENVSRILHCAAVIPGKIVDFSQSAEINNLIDENIVRICEEAGMNRAGFPGD